MSDVCDVALAMVARGVERQVVADRQVVLELVARGADLDVPTIGDAAEILDSWLDVVQAPAERTDRQVILAALGVGHD